MTTVWGSEVELDSAVPPRWLRVLSSIGCSVDADGSNGLTRCSAAEAGRRGLCVPPGALDAPMVAYDRRDLGSRSLWAPAGRLPYGMDAPENGIRVLRNLDGKVVGYRCFGVLGGPDGAPWVQGADDPAPGAFLSTTSLTDGRWPPTSPHRYFDSAALPGWVLPGHDLDGIARVGDLALVSYQGRSIWCQGFDSGNSGHPKIELSVFACDALGGIDSNPRRGGCESGVRVLILPRSRETYWDRGVVRPLSSSAEIQAAGRAAARAAGLQE